jgi:hypothetical protein
VAAHGALAPPATTTSTRDEAIQTTANHPWLTADHGWILASFLRVGEPVQRVDGARGRAKACRHVAWLVLRLSAETEAGTGVRPLGGQEDAATPKRLSDYARRVVGVTV